MVSSPCRAHTGMPAGFFRRHVLFSSLVARPNLWTWCTGQHCFISRRSVAPLQMCATPLSWYLRAHRAGCISFSSSVKITSASLSSHLFGVIMRIPLNLHVSLTGADICLHAINGSSLLELLPCTMCSSGATAHTSPV